MLEGRQCSAATASHLASFMHTVLEGCSALSDIKISFNQCPADHQMQMTAPATDVHGGFVLQLKWLRGASPAVDVVSSTSADGTSL